MRKILILAFFFAVSIVVSAIASPTIEELYQRDADIIRMQHFDYYAGLLDEYYQKKQKYPFQGEKDSPAYVFILNATQEKYFTDNILTKHYRISDTDFFAELERSAEHPIDEKYDPQKFSTDGRPAMYIYMVDGDKMFFAVHLYSGNAFSRTVAQHYHKVELSNVSIPQKNIHTYSELKTSEDYQKLIAKKAEKQAYFDAMDNSSHNDSQQ